jgi:hypothetical protein
MMRVREKGLEEFMRVQGIYVKIVIINYIGAVVKVPGSIKCVGINSENKN